MTKYQELRNEYINLKTEHQRVEWIRENKTEFENLGLSVNSVTSAENVFVNNTNRIIDALDKRAQAAAWAAVAQEKYERAFKAQQNLKNLNDKVTQTNSFVNIKL